MRCNSLPFIAPPDADVGLDNSICNLSPQQQFRDSYARHPGQGLTLFRLPALDRASSTERSRWWKNSPEQFPTTLELHLSVAHLGKLLAHNAALYSPTLRQVGQDQVLALAMQGMRWTDDGWRHWCEIETAADLPMFASRKELSARIAECDHE